MKAFKLLYRALFPILKHFLYPKSKIESYLFRNIHIGKGVHISKNCNIWETSIGDYTFIGENTSIDFVESIGKYCSISKYVHLGLGAHPHKTLSTSPVFYSSKRGFVKQTTFNEQSHPTIIENDVLIGANTCVMKGVRISNGAIIGAGSIVTKDIPPYAIAIGNPARVVKYRFDQKTIDELLTSKWWEKDFDEAFKLYNKHQTSYSKKK